MVRTVQDAVAVVVAVVVDVVVVVFVAAAVWAANDGLLRSFFTMFFLFLCRCSVSRSDHLDRISGAHH